MYLTWQVSRSSSDEQIGTAGLHPRPRMHGERAANLMKRAHCNDGMVASMTYLKEESPAYSLK